MTEYMQVSILGPDEVVWEGKASILSSVNAEGDFDILPGHANFMTLIKDTDVNLVVEGGEEKTFSFDQAVLFFNEDVAKIYIHTSTL